MNITKMAFISAFALTALTGCGSDSPLELKIAHVNDTHSAFDETIAQLSLPDSTGELVNTLAYKGGYSRLKTKIEKEKVIASNEDKEFLLLHGGDAFSGSLYFSAFKGELNAELMNEMNFDAMAIGNHEFDLGNEVLSAFSKKIDFPLLSANLRVPATDPLSGNFLPFTIKKMNESYVALVGLTTTYSDIISSPSEETSFSDTLISSRKTINLLEKAGINKIIFLTHLGLDGDKELAKSLNGIDVIIGGHSHDLLGDHTNIGLSKNEGSPVITEGPEGLTTCIMQAGEKAEALGVTEVSFDKHGLVTQCHGQNTILVGNIFVQNGATPVDSDTYTKINDYINSQTNIEITEKESGIQQILDSAKIIVSEFTAKIIGSTSENLYHVRLPGDVHPTGGAMQTGSMVASHVAASMSLKMESLSNEHRYVGIMNAGGVRSDLEGALTVGSAYSTLPYGSTLTEFTLTGEQLNETLQNSVKNAYLLSSVAMPYTSNLQYTVNLENSNEPTIESIKIINLNGIYEKIEYSKNYKIVTTNYLANGGDLYQFNTTDMIDTGHIDAEVLSSYIEKQPGGVLSVIESGILIK